MTSYNNFQSFSGPPHPPIGNILEKANNNNTKFKGESATRPSFWSNIIQIELGMSHFKVVCEPKVLINKSI